MARFQYVTHIEIDPGVVRLLPQERASADDDEQTHSVKLPMSGPGSVKIGSRGGSGGNSAGNSGGDSGEDSKGFRT